MPEAVCRLLAAAVVAELNGGSFSQPLNAARRYLVKNEVKTDGLVVSVAPTDLDINELTRAQELDDYVIQVGVQQRVRPAVLEDFDALLDLMQELRAFLTRRPLGALPAARWHKIENKPLYLPEHLQQFNQFTSVLAVTYRLTF